MSTQTTPHDVRPSGEIRYEVSISNDIVNLNFHNGDRELSVATDPRSALILASDLLTAVSNTTATPPADPIATESAADRSQFEFD